MQNSNTISLSGEIEKVDYANELCLGNLKIENKLQLRRNKIFHFHHEMVRTNPPQDRCITKIGGPTFFSVTEGVGVRDPYNTNFIDMYKSPYRTALQRFTIQKPPPIAPRQWEALSKHYYQTDSQYEENKKNGRLPISEHKHNLVPKGKAKHVKSNSFMSDSFQAQSFYKKLFDSLPLTPPIIQTSVVSVGDNFGKESGAYLENAINNATTEVELPPNVFELESLRINKCIKIRGSMGARFLVSECIWIEKGATVEFQEIDIEFTPPKLRINEFKGMSLINISNGGNMKLIDCHLHSVADAEVRNIGTLEDACITLHSTENIQNVVKANRGVEIGADLSLTNCSIMNFHSGVICGSNSKCNLFQCSIQKCKNSCLLSVNPELLHVKECSFDNCEEIGIEVIFRDHQPQPSEGGKIKAMYKDKRISKTEIVIECTEIRNIEKAGIAIYSESESPLFRNTKIRIESNAIYLNMGEGIYGKDLDIFSFQILNNKCTHNAGSSIALNNVNMREGGKVICAYNLCINSDNAYGILAVNTCLELISTECLMNKGGIYIIGSHNESKVNYCTCTDNNEQGIAIIDSTGIIHISKCNIHKNKEYGVYHSQHSDYYTNPENPNINISSATHFWASTSLTPNTLELHSQSKPKEQIINSHICSRSKLDIDQCEIKANIKGGVYLNNGRLHLHATVIKEHPIFAIKIPHLVNQSRITFSKKSLEINYLVGSIGGEWGEYKGCELHYPRWASSTKGRRNSIRKCCCLGNKKKKKVAEDPKESKK